MVACRPPPGTTAPQPPATPRRRPPRPRSTRPAAIAAQNRRRSSRRPTGGRPGDRSVARPARSERRLRVVIATSSVEVLRRPLESAGEWLDHCDAWAREVLRARPSGRPRPLVLRGAGRVAEAGTRDVRSSSGIPAGRCQAQALSGPMSAPWLAAWMLWQVKFARDAWAAGNAEKTGLECARLAMWAGGSQRPSSAATGRRPRSATR